MIVLKILLIILLVILGLILLVLILPVGADLSFIDGKLRFKVKLWFLDIMDSEGGGVLGWLKKRKKKPKKPKRPKKPEEEPLAAEETVTEETLEAPETVSESIPEEETLVSEVSGENAAADNSDSEGPDEIFSDVVFEEENEKPEKKKKEKSSSDDSGYELTDKIDFVLSTIDIAWAPLKRIFKGFRFSDFYIDFVLANEDAYKCAINYGRFCGVIYNGIALLSRIFTVRLKTVDVQPGFGLNKSRYDASFSLDFRVGTVVIAGISFLITFLFKVYIPNRRKKRKLRKAAAVQK